MKYTEVMTKQADVGATLNALLDKGKGALSSLAPGELGWGAVGAGGGAMLGYTLARLLHRKPGTKTKLLYALLGAAAGGAGSHYALQSLPSSSGNGSKLDEIRESAGSDKPEPIPAEDVPTGDGNILPWRPRTTALTAAGIGAVRGATRGTRKGSLLAPNVYEAWRHRSNNDLETLQDRLNSTYTDELARRSKLQQLGNRIKGYDASVDVDGRIALKDSGYNMARGLSNAAAGALIHGAVAGGLHAGVNALTRRFSQDIDAQNAAATREQLIRNLTGK